MEKQPGHPTQEEPLMILKFKFQVWTSSESMQQENKDWNNVMGGLEPSSHTGRSLLRGYWCKHKCRCFFEAACAAWITVSWKLGTVEQWNLVHVQTGPLRVSSHVHTNSISRGEYYQKESADMRECFPESIMINTERDLSKAARSALSWVVWGDEFDWVNWPRSLYCIYRKIMTSKECYRVGISFVDLLH